MENATENTKENNSQKPMDSKPIVGAILIVGIMIAGAILLKGGGGVNTSSKTPISKEDHILGNPKAEIVIVEYSDTECPFCKVFHQTMHQVVNKSEGKVAWVYKHYPIEGLHPKAPLEAEATECAWEQGGNTVFWEYIDEVFLRTESNNKLDLAELPKIAESLGLDVGKFNSCVDSGKYKEKVQSDISEGNLRGVRGTPSSFILKNGSVVGTIPGAQSFEGVMAQLETLLID